MGKASFIIKKLIKPKKSKVKITALKQLQANINKAVGPKQVINTVLKEREKLERQLARASSAKRISELEKALEYVESIGLQKGGIIRPKVKPKGRPKRRK